ncbi:taurine catabolism dioxygenase [Aaosphaeria arxii CBS 175.79]|uniref:Taurine catabolism dioxygenase n=1 Tax=Aaosphaeria arxii CBS 175.79 TaxID=1450172 RepID=A0A6A5XXZ4_9PLEO|nr:taurine catabolism dioxygenase [Aaosphaeria arxii CBS 175.79]KAF2017826.1 taurine catabolism dioxygenase [Aaosphaeria arxii CBS 175.79]
MAVPQQNGSNGTAAYPTPLKKTGVLDQKFKHEETTPVIGREYFDVNIVDDLLNASDGDDLIRDLAITISERGVVFFRAQDNLTDTLQKQLVHRLGQLTGKPSSSTLHIHPMLNNTNEFGVADAEISTISSLARKKFFNKNTTPNTRRYDAAQWHSDIQFEPVPADYTSLRLTQLPSSGGDTLWASGYEIYDRFSPAYQKFFEGLTAEFVGDGFIKAADANPEHVKLYTDARGSPQNVGRELRATHPVVRTNPVTGWKSIFALGPFPKSIHELTAEESEELLKKFRSVITESHDLTVRFKWRNKNDIAIWDNRSAFHTATFDYDGLGERFGNRAVGIGEAPYLDPNSQSRTKVLEQAAGKDLVDRTVKNGLEKPETVSA